MSNGLIIRPAKKNHWEMGSGKARRKLGADAGVLNPKGDWTLYDSDKEIQNKNGLETYNCTAYGTLLALQALAKKKGYTFFPLNCSERYTGVVSGTEIGGNDPWKVAELIATKYGVIPNEALPWSDDITLWEQYYAPKPMTKEFIALGESMLRRVEIEPQWVFPPYSNYSPKEKAKRLAEALTRGPVCVSVLIGQTINGKYYKKEGATDVHWVWLPKMDQVRDQYKPFVKKLVKEYDHNMAIMYFMRINESGVLPKDKPLYLSLLLKLIALLQEAKKRLGIWKQR